MTEAQHCNEASHQKQWKTRLGLSVLGGGLSGTMYKAISYGRWT